MRHQIKPGYGLQKYSGGQKTDAGGATGASERAEADAPAAALAPKPTPAQVEASAAAARHVRAARKPLTEAEKATRRAEVQPDDSYGHSKYSHSEHSHREYSGHSWLTLYTLYLQLY